jgi:hypothetical protein
VATYNVGGRLYNGIINERITMKDTRNIYLVQTSDGNTFEVQSVLDQSDWFIDNYYSGRITRLWINGVEFVEPTE